MWLTETPFAVLAETPCTQLCQVRSGMAAGHHHLPSQRKDDTNLRLPCGEAPTRQANARHLRPMDYGRGLHLRNANEN